MVQKRGAAQDLAWLLDDFVERVAHAEKAIVLSNDGLLIASSKDLSHEDAEHLAAAAAGFRSLARGTGRYIGGGTVRQTTVELEKAFFLVTAAGNDACLAVQLSSDAEVGLIAAELARLVTSVATCLSRSSRTTPTPGEW